MSRNVTASRIRFRRAQLGLSQSELASKMNVDRSTIAKWESGDNNLRQGVLKQLANALNCSPVWLAGLDSMEMNVEALESQMKGLEVKQLTRLSKYIDYLLEIRGSES